MALTIISGRAGTGKTTYIQQEVGDALRKEPIGAPIFLIVPDQMSFSTEYELTQLEGVEGMVRAQATKFKRLAWRVLTDVGGISREEINGFGYRMLIRNTLLELKDELSLFKKSANKRGFTEEIESLLKEFSRYSIDGAKLAELASQLKEDDHSPLTLQNKMHDLHLIMQSIEEKLGTSYVDSEGYIPLLINCVQQSELIRQSHIYIDGFTSFTTREFELVAMLLTVAKDVTVALPFDDEAAADDDHSLFHEPAKTARHLKDIAFQQGVEVKKTIHLTQQLKFKSNDLAYIEKQLDNYPIERMKEHPDGGLSLFAATSRSAEIHGVAREIRRLVQEEHYRYRHIAILYRQANIYDPILETVFKEYDIPLFLSQTKAMLHHPLIELCRSSLEIIQKEWAYEPVFRAIKTDLFFPTAANMTVWRERADRMENFVIAQGIFGERWFDERRWLYKKYRGLEFYSTNQTDEERAIQAEIAAMRSHFREPLLALEKAIDQASTGIDYASALFEFLEQQQVFEKMMTMKDSEMEKGKLLEATEHDQVWNGVVDLLDQFVTMFGTTELTLDEVVAILDEGYDSLSFSRIPPSVDQVTVATADLARLSKMKAVFVIGMNEGVYPVRIDHEGIIADSEREWFTRLGHNIAPTSKERLLEEDLITYAAFTSASHKLIVSYTMSDEEGKSVLPSLFINRLKDLTGVEESIIFMTPDEALTSEEDWSYISHPRTALAYLMGQIRQNIYDKKPLTPEWQALRSYYEQDVTWSVILQRLMKPLTTHNKAEQLTPDITAELYGQHLNSSVTRVENYYKCPFSHFASYGLQLQERQEYRLEPPTIGELFHEALKWISNETAAKNISWGQLSPPQCKQLAAEAVEFVVPMLYHQILLSTARYRYILRKLTQIVERTMLSLSNHAKNTGFRQIAIEAAFGPGEQLPPMIIKIDENREMRMRGRIDRIDSTTINDEAYLRVIDYKSSAQKLDLNNVYHGLSLQMLTYLDVAVENASQWLPVHTEAGGVLYIHMHNPMIKADTMIDDYQSEEEILKEFKMNGLLLDQKDVILEMDESLEDSGGRSKVIPVQIKKDGEVSKATSSVIEKADLDDLRLFIRQKHREAGQGILDGHTAISPYRMKQRTACDYCPHKAVCQFDTTDVQQRYRSLETTKADDLIDKMKREVHVNDSE
ncbi:helicase-exonuclease AddAB subunit AddB [Kurthia sibirica]|uniref:ATP-dependent helicase/deoxyribonuclease subunit B n=1 Tax=Kurthia sibirica TaxID=202750 RepID=A0A2U3AMR1_9BACL|nr:helicase-exonuclease AddAB subunit AddB [Kurthia sibirica]PWI25828.1 helicase-exonuclease AddAB subunit AddB [Kurthia sibirica]GEK33647.1 ATP-dependent helicase/deoxyribonuclease subunit B [Kurthia sibirica]